MDERDRKPVDGEEKWPDFARGQAEEPDAQGDQRRGQFAKGQAEKNGLFASHPETQERIGKVKQLAASKPGAIVAARYTAAIKYQPTDLTKIATVVEGSAGLAGAKPAPKPEDKKAEEKKAEEKKSEDK